MDHPNHITYHQKGKHLTFEDYVLIELRIKDGWTANRIATKELHCSPNTVRNIIKKGITSLYHGKVYRFKARTAWAAYQQNRSNCCRNYDALDKRGFISYVEELFTGTKAGHWMHVPSAQSCSAASKKVILFAPKHCTTM